MESTVDQFMFAAIYVCVSANQSISLININIRDFGRTSAHRVYSDCKCLCAINIRVFYQIAKISTH